MKLSGVEGNVLTAAALSVPGEKQQDQYLSLDIKGEYKTSSQIIVLDAHDCVALGIRLLQHALAQGLVIPKL